MWEALVLPIHSLNTYCSHIDVCTVCIHLFTLFTFETYISYRVFWTPPTSSKFIQERHWMNQRILDFDQMNGHSLVGKWCPKFFTIPKLFPGSFQKLLFCSFQNLFYVHSLSCIVQQWSGAVGMVFLNPPNKLPCLMGGSWPLKCKQTNR